MSNSVCNIHVYMEDWAFEASTARQKLTSHFQTTSHEGFGIEKDNEE